MTLEDNYRKLNLTMHFRPFSLPWALGGVALIGVLLLIIFPQWFTPYDPFEISASDRLQAPNMRHPFGTDRVGRDILSRMIAGARFSFLVPLGIVLFAVAGGLLFGMLAGYYRRLDNLIMRIMDGLMSFPFILLAVAVLAIMGRGPRNVVIAVGIVYMPMIARVVRSGVLAQREAMFIEAARAVGASDLRILLRHLLPNVVPLVIVQGTYFFARALLTEAALSFLGLGLPPSMPSWGVVLGEGRQFLRQAPWTTIFPGLTISTIVVMLNVIGDRTRDRLDPRLRGVGES